MPFCMEYFGHLLTEGIGDESRGANRDATDAYFLEQRRHSMDEIRGWKTIFFTVDPRRCSLWLLTSFPGLVARVTHVMFQSYFSPQFEPIARRSRRRHGYHLKVVIKIEMNRCPDSSAWRCPSDEECLFPLIRHLQSLRREISSRCLPEPFA